jgi:phosphohistidine phosphatase
MKTLYLLRHAKSSWRDSSLADFERPLKKKGQFQADQLSDHLSSLLPPPTRVLCSPALRTRETLHYFLEQWPLPKSAISYPDDLYLADRETLFRLIQALPKKDDIVLLVGHNPGLSHFGRKLFRPETEELDDLKPCAFLQVDFEVDDWAEVTPHTGWRKLLIRPRALEV